MTATKQTFKVVNHNTGEVVAHGLSALQAMSEILSYDGYTWKFKRAKDGYLTLWHSDGSRNSTRGARHFVQTVAGSYEAGIAGQRDIARQVITADWGLALSAVAE